MAPSISKKRKLEDGLKGKVGKPPRKFRKQNHYSSPSPSPSSAAEDFAPVSLGDSDIDDPPSLSHEASPSRSSGIAPSPASSDSDTESRSASDSSSEANSQDEPSSNPNLSKRKIRKANDPAAFSNSIAKILGSKLSTSKRADPVLARSATAKEANESLSNSRLEAKARQKLREDRKKDMEKGRVKDVLLGTDAPKAHAIGIVRDGAEGVITVGELQEQEKRLRKTAQRGVVKLFNAVRAAQVKGEEAARTEKGGGRDRKQERVGEMSKQGFLELVAGGGSKNKAIAAGIEEG